MNANALRGEVKRNGLTLAEVAKSIGISESSMSRKLKNGTFCLDEAVKLVELLDIKEPTEIFFAR